MSQLPDIFLLLNKRLENWINKLKAVIIKRMKIKSHTWCKYSSSAEKFLSEKKETPEPK